MIYMATALIVGYLIGSINPAIIISKLKGRDLRKMGSHNAGATNMLRTYGKGLAIVVTLLDVIKTLVAIASAYVMMLPFEEATSDHIYILQIFAAAGCILGHNFPLYFKFKGGKGVLCSVTAIMWFDYRIGILALLVFVLAVVMTRFVSLGSILGAVAAVMIAYITNANKNLLYFLMFAAVLLIVRHRMNIIRIIKGKEHKLGENKKEKYYKKYYKKETE